MLSADIVSPGFVAVIVILIVVLLINTFPICRTIE